MYLYCFLLVCMEIHMKRVTIVSLWNLCYLHMLRLYFFNKLFQFDIFMFVVRLLCYIISCNARGRIKWRLVWYLIIMYIIFYRRVVLRMYMLPHVVQNNVNFVPTNKMESIILVCIMMDKRWLFLDGNMQCAPIM